MAQHSFEEIFLKKIVNELPNASNVCHEKVFRKLQEQVNYKRLVNTKEQYLDAPTNSSIEIESGKSRLAFAKISLLVCRIYDEIDILVKEELQCKTYKEAVLEASEQKFSCGVSTPAPKSPIKQKKNNEKIIQEAFEDLSNCLRNLDCAQNLNTTRKSKEIFPDVSEGKRKRDFDDDSDLDASDLTSFEDEIILTSDEESGTKKKKILLKDVKEKPEQANDKKLKESDGIQVENEAEDNTNTQSEKPLNGHDSSNISHKSQRKRKPNMKYAADIMLPFKKEKTSTDRSSAHSEVPQKAGKTKAVLH